jgi:hypothetical protein
MPEVIYVVYDVTNNKAMGHYYNAQYEANNQIKLLRAICPDNKYQLVVYRRCMNCDT